MALNKVIYVDGETVITAENLNDIQDAIIDLEQGGTIVVFDFTLDSDLQVTSGPTWTEVYNVADSKIVFARATTSGGSILLMPLVDGENYIFSAIDNLGTIHSIIPGQSYHSWEYIDNGLGEDIAALWNDKLDNNLGISEAGKFLVVGNDGAVTTMTLATWQAGSY